MQKKKRPRLAPANAKLLYKNKKSTVEKTKKDSKEDLPKDKIHCEIYGHFKRIAGL